MKEESDSLEEQLAEIGHIFQWTYFHVGLDRYQFLEDNFLGGGTDDRKHALFHKLRRHKIRNFGPPRARAKMNGKI